MSVKNVEDVYALSPMQQLMLLQASSPANHGGLVEQFTCSLIGNLDCVAFRRAWEETVRRHAVLRTGFAWQGLKKPLQFVRRNVKLHWQEHDIRAANDTDRVHSWSKITEVDRRKGFDLTSPPLLRISLARVADDVYRFGWTVHHLILDGWSLPLVLKDVFAAYDALRTGAPLRLPPSPPFAEYIRWLSQQDREAARQYWQRRLAGCPLNSRRLGIAAFKQFVDPRLDYGEFETSLSKRQLSKLETDAAAQRVTVATLVVAAWGLSLGHLQGHDEVICGLAVSGRPASLAGANEIVGPLMNNLPFRLKLPRDEFVGDWLRTIQSDLTDQQQFEYTFCEQVSDQPSGGRLFDSLLVYENYPRENSGRIGTDLEICDVHATATSNLPLTAIVIPDEYLRLRLRYRIEDFSLATIQQLSVQFEATLESMIADTGQRLVDVRAVSRQQQTDSMGHLHEVSMDDCRIDLDGVRDHVLGHAAVADTTILAYDAADGSRRLAVYVVATKDSMSLLDADGQLLLGSQLRSSLDQVIPLSVVPVDIVTLDRVPRLADGATDVASLPTPRRSRPLLAAEYVAPRDQIETRLADIWSELFGVDRIGVQDSFVDLGGHSALAVSLIARIEKEFQRKLPLVAMYSEPTIERLAGLLRRPVASLQETVLVPIHAQGSRSPLFCIHPAGGTVFCYLELARHLDPEQPVYGLQAVGIDGRQAPHTTVPEMAAHYVAEMRTAQSDGPYAICGWSSGGIVAYEVARQLELEGQTVSLLALFDAAIRGDDGEYTREDVLAMLLMMFPGDSRQEIEALRDASLAQQLAYFEQRAKSARLVWEDADPTQIRFIHDVFQANADAIASYRPEPYQGKVTLFRAATAATPMHRDPELGWGQLAGNVEVCEVPGDHVTMFREPTVQLLASQLARYL